VSYDLEERREDFAELFQLVKLHLLPASYLEAIVANQELVKQSHECKDYFQKELLYRLKLPSSMQSSHESPNSPSMQSSHESPNSSSTQSSHKSPNTTIASSSNETTVEPPTQTNTEETKETKILSPKLPLNDPVSKQSDPKKKKRGKSSPSPQKAANASPQSPAVPLLPLPRLPPPIKDPPGPSQISSSSNQSNDYLLSKELARILRHGKYPDITLDSGKLTFHFAFFLENFNKKYDFRIYHFQVLHGIFGLLTYCILG